MTDTTPQPEQAPETIAAPQATAEQLADEREDAVLMQIDGDDPDDEQPEPQAPAAEEAAPEAAPAVETEQVSDTGDIEEAWSVLRRDGFSKDDLAALSDEAITRLAAHRKKVQTDVDRKLSEAKQPQPNEADEESRQQPEEPAVAEATPKDVTDDHLRNAARMFAEAVDLDDESTNLLAASYAAVVEPFKQQLAGMQEWMARQQVEATRQQLVEQYPQVSDPSSEGFGRVVTRMTKLAEDQGVSDMRALMEDAIAFEFREELRQQAQEAKDTVRTYRSNGVPSRSDGVVPVPEKDPSQLEDEILAILESGAPDARERARRLTGR
jgi:hypothetical protein